MGKAIARVSLSKDRQHASEKAKAATRKKIAIAQELAVFWQARAQKLVESHDPEETDSSDSESSESSEEIESPMRRKDLEVACKAPVAVDTDRESSRTQPMMKVQQDPKRNSRTNSRRCTGSQRLSRTRHSETTDRSRSIVGPRLCSGGAALPILKVRRGSDTFRISPNAYPPDFEDVARAVFQVAGQSIGHARYSDVVGDSCVLCPNTFVDFLTTAYDELGDCLVLSLASEEPLLPSGQTSVPSQQISLAGDVSDSDSGSFALVYDAQTGATVGEVPASSPALQDLTKEHRDDDVPSS